MSDLDGATTRGPDNAYPATPGEFAARWNEMPEEHRAAWLALRINDAEVAHRCIVEGHVDFDSAVQTAASRYHDTECVYGLLIARAIDRLNAASIPQGMTEAMFNAATILDVRRILTEPLSPGSGTGDTHG